MLSRLELKALSADHWKCGDCGKINHVQNRNCLNCGYEPKIDNPIKPQQPAKCPEIGCKDGMVFVAGGPRKPCPICNDQQPKEQG